MKNLFLSVKTRKRSFLGIKLSTSVLVQTYKSHILLNFSLKLLLFSFFKHNNAENEDFNQHLGWSAPKRWSKYTTRNLKMLFPENVFFRSPGFCILQSLCRCCALQAELCWKKFYISKLYDSIIQRLDSIIDSKSSNNTYLNISEILFLL